MIDIKEQESNQEKSVLTMIDTILEYPNMRKFIEVVEGEFSKIMNSERANLVIVDRFRRDLFKYNYDE
jgi:hypothetical protein